MILRRRCVSAIGVGDETAEAELDGFRRAVRLVPDCGRYSVGGGGGSRGFWCICVVTCGWHSGRPPS